MPNRPGEWPQEFSKGQRLKAKDLDRMNKVSFTPTITGSGGISVETYGNRVVIKGSPARVGGGASSSGNTQIRRMTYRSMAADYIICRDANSVDHKVAKPYLLQRTPFDGASRDSVFYTYTSDAGRGAVKGTASETQVIVPSYIVGDEIVVVKGLLEGTGVTDCLYMDLNLGGRAWAREE